MRPQRVTRVAFATADCEHVDAEFRRAPHLVVFEWTPAGFDVDRVYAFRPGGRASTEDRIRTILGVDVVYVAAIGPSQAARLAGHGIQPATAPARSRIRAVLEVLADHRRGEGAAL